LSYRPNEKYEKVSELVDQKIVCVQAWKFLGFATECQGLNIEHPQSDIIGKNILKFYCFFYTTAYYYGAVASLFGVARHCWLN
jgi:hypothetical protein